MQRVVIDTNILVSALISQSYPASIVDLFFIGDSIQWCISDAVLSEYAEVLSRPKFEKYPGFRNNAESLLDDIGVIGNKFYPAVTVDIISDKSDNKFLELALASNAHFLITGNTNDFTISSFGLMKIVSPKEYWEKYR